MDKKILALAIMALIALCSVSAFAFKLPVISPYAQKSIIFKANPFFADKFQPRIRVPICVKELTPENYWNTIRTSEKPAIVKFYSQLCEPCRKMAPYYEQACREYRGTADFFAFDIFQDIDFYFSFGLSHVPALLFYNDGREVERVTNITPDIEFLRQEIDDFLAGI